MKATINSVAEAILAASHERICRNLHHISYIELVARFGTTGSPVDESMLRQVHAEIAREVIEYLGEEVAQEFPLQ